MMLGLTRLLVFLSIFSAITLKPNAKTISKPDLFHFPITKQEPDNLFYTTLNVGSAGKSPVNLVLDLGTNVTWLNCRKLKSLSSLRPVTCKSSTCKSIPRTSCNERSCLYEQFNPYAQDPVSGRVVQDGISFNAIDFLGSKTLAPVSLRRFTFVCAGQKNLQDLSNPIDGVLGLSPGDTAFTKQVTSAFGVIPKFYLCLPSSSSGSGHMFVGGGLSFTRTFTPLTGPVSEGYPLTVNSIYVDGVDISLKPGLLNGRAKLLSGLPYTALHTHIYNALAKSFTQRAKAMGISKVRAIEPFKDCFNARTIRRNSTGPIVPVIEIGMPGRAGEVRWRFNGANAVVKMSETVMCLAFLDIGTREKEIYMGLGTHQIQDYMLEFDLSTTRLGFSDSLLLQNTSCSTWAPQK